MTTRRGALVGHGSVIGVGWGCALLFALAACVTPATQVPPPVVDDGPALAPRAALERFLAEERAQDFDAAYRDLSADLRQRYTPARLASDHQRDVELAHDNLARIRAALAGGTPVVLDGPDRAHLALAPERGVQLVREPQGWRVESLE